MSRVNAPIFDRPGPASGTILTRGVNRASEILGNSITNLEQRQDDMRRKRDGAEQFNKNTIELTKSRIRASEGPIDDMTEEIEKTRQALQKEIEQVEDSVLRGMMLTNLDEQTARAMSNTLLMQNSRNVGQSIAVGEEMLTTGIQAIQNGLSTAGEVHDSIQLYINAQKENVYGEDAEKTVQSMAGQLADEQFNVLLKTNPGAALVYPDGEFAKRWLDPRERRELKSIANNVIAGNLSNIDSRGAAIQSSALPDREERLRQLKVEAMRQPDIPRRKTTITRLDSWISKANSSSITRADRIKKFGDVLIGRSKDPLPQDQSTLNGAYQQLKNIDGSIPGFISALTDVGSDYPNDFIKDLKRAGKPETLDLQKIEDSLRVMSPDRADLVAQSTGLIGETAYGSTRRLTSPNEITERNAVLGRANAMALISQADDLLEDNDLLNSARLSVPLLFPVTAGVFVPIPFISVKAGNIRLAPTQTKELQDLYRFQYVQQQGGFDDPEKLKKSALNAAGLEFRDSHVIINVAVTGRNRTYLIPKSSLSFNDSFSEKQAIEEMTPLVSALMRDSGTRSGLLAGNPIISHVNSTAAFAITNTSGIKGFVQWDANLGIATTILPNDEREFAALSGRLVNMRGSLNPTPDLIAAAGVTVMPESVMDNIMDIAIVTFRNQNSGRIPSTDADEATLIAIAETIADENGWKP